MRDELLALIDQGKPLTVATASSLLGASNNMVQRLRFALQLPWPCRVCGRLVPFPSEGSLRRPRCEGCARLLAEAKAVAAEAKAAHQAGGPKMGPRRSRLRDQLLALIDKREPLSITKASGLLGADRKMVQRLWFALQLPWPCDACGRLVPFQPEKDNQPMRCQECVRMMAEAKAARLAEAKWKKTHCRRCGAFIGPDRMPSGQRLLCVPCHRRVAAAYQSARRYRQGGSQDGFCVDSRRKYPVSDVLEYLEEHGHDGP